MAAIDFALQTAASDLSGSRKIQVVQFLRDHAASTPLLRQGEEIMVCGKALNVQKNEFDLEALEFQPWQGWITKETPKVFHLIIPDLHR